MTSPRITDPAVRECLAALGQTFARMDKTIKAIVPQPPPIRDGGPWDGRKELREKQS